MDEANLILSVQEKKSPSSEINYHVRNHLKGDFTMGGVLERLSVCEVIPVRCSSHRSFHSASPCDVQGVTSDLLVKKGRQQERKMC